ncbi:MAG: hypothetical protein KKA90_03085 [Nanoarchaeota archaeon]|nr:hypothetical protein [Nanoarchaeota archaeon]
MKLLLFALIAILLVAGCTTIPADTGGDNGATANVDDEINTALENELNQLPDESLDDLQNELLGDL